MAWTPTIPAEPPVQPGWWAHRQAVESVREVCEWADERTRAKERVKQIRRLRRQAERINEQIVVAEGAIAARQYQRRLYGRADVDWYKHGTMEGRQGIPYERSARPDEVEYFTRPGRILSVR